MGWGQLIECPSLSLLLGFFQDVASCPSCPWSLLPQENTRPALVSHTV